MSLSGIMLGRAGEETVALLLRAEGWELLARNFRAGRGEIDIVARRGGIIAFVEVKTWSAFGVEELGAALSPGKRRRIIETSKIFLSRDREYSEARLRYDLFFVRGGRVERRIESAFTGEL